LEAGKPIEIYNILDTYDDKIYLNDTYESLYTRYAGDIYTPIPGAIFPSLILSTGNDQKL
jgi:hypothetical protein